jgi:hypothetical protein
MTCAAHPSTEVEKSPWQQHPPKIAQPVRRSETRRRPDHPRHICPRSASCAGPLFASMYVNEPLMGVTDGSCRLFGMRSST